MSFLSEVLKTGICPVCDKAKDDIDEQYSFGVYAGVMCRECACRKYWDRCGHRPEGQGNPSDLDEDYWGDE